MVTRCTKQGEVMLYLCDKHQHEQIFLIYRGFFATQKLAFIRPFYHTHTLDCKFLIIEPFTWVMAWKNIIPFQHFVSLLEKHFFPKWMQVWIIISSLLYFLKNDQYWSTSPFPMNHYARSSLLMPHLCGTITIMHLYVFDELSGPSNALTYNRTALLDRPEKAWSQDGGNMRVFAHEVTCWPVLFVYFCMLEEPAMFKTLSYSSVFVSIHQYSWRSIGHAWLKVKSIDQAVQFYYMSMVQCRSRLSVQQDQLHISFQT